MSAQQALALPLPAASNTVVINARCSLRIEADQRVVVVGGLPVHHYRAEDVVAEAYAMVFLVESGFAQQTDVARAFGRSVRTVRRYQGRYAQGGMAALGRRGGLASRSTTHLREASAQHRDTEEPGDEQPGDRAPAGGQREGDPQAGRTFEAGRERAACVRRDDDRGGRCAAVHQVPASNADDAPVSAEDRAGDSDPIGAPADDDEPVPMSLDRDASDRTFDRQLAYLGLLDDAAPLFRDGTSVPGAGVLLRSAVPGRERAVSDQPQALRRDRSGLLWPAHDVADAAAHGAAAHQAAEHLKERRPGRVRQAARARPGAGSEDAATPAHAVWRRTIAPSSWAPSLRVCVSISAAISWASCTSTAMCAPITANAPSRRRLTWRAVIWPCPPAPTTGSTTAPAIRCW